MNNALFTEDQIIKNQITSAINDYSSDDWEVRLKAIKSIEKYGNSIYAKNIIILMLLAAEDCHPIVQLEAIENLKIIKPDAAVDTLQHIALNDNNHNVRYAALTALSAYNSHGNIEIFIENLSNHDWLIREAAYLGLLSITPLEDQRDYITKIVKGINDDSLSIRIAVLSNVKIQDPRIYSEIIKIIKDRKSKFSLLKASLVAIKGYMLDSETRERLMKLLTHRNKDIRILSLQALKQEKIELNF